ncbi:hypothetical protein WA026_000172 [Henosepilachna vigintioctopunctata]|uniref:AB hydrolase-1 domain-containing protein n=1 Tax=Henosepilachna vigintioctopunctata TaxID=420089 RepID=A0AAW1V7H7_9CUCU
MTSEQLNGHVKEMPVPDVHYEEVKIPVPWGHISGKWWGPKAKQPIITLHGWQDNSGTFDTLAPLLRDRGISLLCIDLPGHGFSSHLPPGQFYYLFWDGVHFLRRIVKFFNYQKITLLGHSLGGGISFLYAAIYPEEVDRYISIDIASPSVFPVEFLKELQPKHIDTIFKYENLKPHQQPRYDYEEMVDLVFSAHKGSLTRESAQIMLRRGMVPDSSKPNCYTLTRDPRLKVSLLASFSKDQVLEYASRIRCKVLNIRAIPGYPFDSQLYEQVLNCIANNAELTRVEVLGTHHLHLNDPESIVDHVYNFLTA